MSNQHTKLATAFVILMLVSSLPVPVAAESGTVTSSGPDVTVTGSEITILFDIQNTGSQPEPYILELALPSGWEVVDHTDDGATWSSSKSKWLWQRIDVDETRTATVTIQIPDDASQSAPVEGILKSSAGDLQTTTHDITFYDNQDQVNVANARLSPATVTPTSSTHTLTFDAFSVSADGSPDEFTVDLPDTVDLEAVTDVRTTSGEYEISTKSTRSSITFQSDPTARTDIVNMSIEVDMQLSKVSE